MASHNLTQPCNDTASISRKNEFFKNAWQTICEILSTALFKRPSYLVKSRVPLIVSIFRNLLFGLTAISDQSFYDMKKDKMLQSEYQIKKECKLDVQELENMSHNLDRCLDLIRGDKLKDDFARIAPYMIADILEAGFSGRVTVIQTVKTNLLSGMFKVSK